MMRKDKDTSSVEKNSRIPGAVSGGGKTKVESPESSITRNLRSNSRNTSSSRPIRINRDCLKEISVAQKRGVKRVTRKAKSNGPSETNKAAHSTSEIMSRAPVPRSTSNSCVKPVISTTTSQIFTSTRVRRSAVPKTILSVQSPKTNANTKTKIATVNNTCCSTSARILRSHVLASRDPKIIASAPSKIQKFPWNLRSRSSVAKTDSKTNENEEAKPSLRKRKALRETEGTSLSKHLTVGADEGPGPKEEKQEPQPLVVKTEQNKIKKVVEVQESFSEQEQNEVGLDLSKNVKPGDELESAQPSEVLILNVSADQSLANTTTKAPKRQQTSSRVEEQQPCVKKSKQDLDLKKAGETRPIVVEVLVQEQNLEERPLAHKDSEVKIRDKHAQESKEVSSQESFLPLEVFTSVQPQLVKRILDDLVSKVAKETDTLLAKEVSKSPEGFEIKTTTAKEVNTWIPAKNIFRSDEKLASQESPGGEIPPLVRRIPQGASLCNDMPTPETLHKSEVSLKPSEVLPKNCTVESSFIVEDTFPVKLAASFNGIADTLTTFTDASNKISNVDSDKIQTSKPETSSEEASAAEKTAVTPVHKDKPSFAEFKTTKPLKNENADVLLLKQHCGNKHGAENICKSHSDAPKRPASLTSEDCKTITKKQRFSSSENGADKSCQLGSAIQLLLPQTTNIIGRILPTASNQAMEIDTSEMQTKLAYHRIPPAGNTPLMDFRFNAASAGNDMEMSDPEDFSFWNPLGSKVATSSVQFPRSTGRNGQRKVGRERTRRYNFNFGIPQGGQNGQNISEDMEMIESGTSQTSLVTFGCSQPTAAPIFGAAPFVFTPSSPCQKAAQPSFILNKQQPTLVNADGSPRKFLSGNRYRRRHASRIGFSNLSQASNPTATLVFANGLQRNLSGGFLKVQSPTPMESEGFSGNVTGNGNSQRNVMNSQMLNVLNTQRQQFTGQQQNDCKRVIFGSFQSSPGQNSSVHPMEESLQTTPSLIVGDGPSLARSTLSCFAFSSSTKQHETTLQRAQRLPMIATSTTQTPAPPRAQESCADSFPRENISRLTSINTPYKTTTNPSRETTTSIPREDACKHKTEVGKQERSLAVSEKLLDTGPLHKIYSSVSSLSSCCSRDSDCEGELETLIEGLSQSVSNCSLDNSPEKDDIGKLIEKFKTLNISDTSLNSDVDA